MENTGFQVEPRFTKDQYKRMQEALIKGATNEINSTISFCSTLAMLVALGAVNGGELLKIYKETFKKNLESIKGDPSKVGLQEDINNLIDVDATIDNIAESYFNVVNALEASLQDAKN